MYSVLGGVAHVHVVTKAKGGAFIERLQQCVGSSSPEIRTASVRLVLGLIEDIEPKNAEVLIPSMPGVVAAIQGLSANNENEQYLKENGDHDTCSHASSNSWIPVRGGCLVRGLWWQ